MAKRFCIFCGNSAFRKNCEHVLPRWMIRESNRPGRNCTFPGPETTKIIPWDSIRFPSCTQCNSRYSILESAVRNVFRKLQNDSLLTCYDIEDLIDWLDKIRVGSYLGIQLFWRQEDLNRPGFLIDGEIGRRDAIIWVFRSLSQRRQLGTCVGGPGFEYCPNHFGIFLNNVAVVQYTDTNLGDRFVREWRDGEMIPNIATSGVYHSSIRREYKMRTSPLICQESTMYFRPRGRRELGDQENGLGYYRLVQPIVYQRCNDQLVLMDPGFSYALNRGVFSKQDPMLHAAHVLGFRVGEYVTQTHYAQTPKQDSEAYQNLKFINQYLTSLRQHFEDWENFKKLMSHQITLLRWADGKVIVSHEQPKPSEP